MSFKDLPQEMVVEIALKADYNNVKSMCQTNRVLRDICLDNQFWYHYCIYHGYINEDYDILTNYRVFARYPELVQLLQSDTIDESHLPYLMGLQAKKRLVSENYLSHFSLELYRASPNAQLSTDQDQINIWLSSGDDENYLVGPLYQIRLPSAEIWDYYDSRARKLLETRPQIELDLYEKNLKIAGESPVVENIGIDMLPSLLNASFNLSQQMGPYEYEIKIQLGLTNDILTIDLTYHSKHLKDSPVKGPSFEFVIMV